MDGELSALIGRVYASVHDTRSFDACIAELMPRTGARIALVIATDPADAGFVDLRMHGATASRHVDCLAEYQAEMWQHDPTFAYLSANPGARFFDTALHRDAAEHRADPYLKFNRHFALASHWMICHSARESGSSFGMSLHPDDATEPFSDRARAEFQLVFEHVERAQWLATRPPDVANSADAVLVVDPHRCIRIASAGADAILARGDGLRAAGGRLTTADPRQARRLEALIEAALSAVSRGGLGGEMLVARVSQQEGWSGARPYAVLVDPLPDQAQLASFARGALIRIVDPDAHPTPGAVARWKALWGLTAAETRAAAALVAHEFDLRAAAATSGITYATMRTQLAAVFAKTGTRGQPELMRLLTRVPG